ncbi:MAG: hypothetical protein DYG98_05610 [Haliscomenobacteraceae bacterium CHB4]|nr:hypothetical protein [Haliscomenobacteraceae bacterium CHB4]
MNGKATNTCKLLIFSLYLTKNYFMKKRRNPTGNDPLETHNTPDINRINQALDYPGYPHYPPRQDVLDQRSDHEKVGIDVENLSRSTWTAVRDEAVKHLGEEKARGDITREVTADEVLPNEEEMDTVAVAAVLDPDAVVTEEDLALLGDRDRDMDGLDDEEMSNYKGLDTADFEGTPLNENSRNVFAEGLDLDVPVGERDDSGTAVKQEDEENDYFSLGAEKDTLEENNL